MNDIFCVVVFLVEGLFTNYVSDRRGRGGEVVWQMLTLAEKRGDGYPACTPLDTSPGHRPPLYVQFS